MKVILCEHVASLGEMGDTVKVADGYARNFLLPRRLAVSFDSASAKQIEHELRAIKKREDKVRVKLQEVAARMEEQTIELKRRAGEEEKLFGSVTTANIAEGLKALGFDVDRKSVLLEEPIKALGVYTVPVKLGSGVQAKVIVSVLPEEVEEVAAVVEDDHEDYDGDLDTMAAAETTVYRRKSSRGARKAAGETLEAETAGAPAPAEDAPAETAAAAGAEEAASGEA